MQTAIFSGLHCDACVKLITKKLQQLTGVETIEPTKPKGTFNISGSKAFTAEEIKAAVKDLDYSLISIQ